MVTIYKDEEITVDICYAHMYFEVFGLSDEEEREVLAYYDYECSKECSSNKEETGNMSKLRVGGETIDPKKQYNGSKVIELLNTSYNNGYNSGRRDHDSSIQAAYTGGYKAGYEEASTDLMQLKELLARLLG